MSLLSLFKRKRNKGEILEKEKHAGETEWDLAPVTLTVDVWVDEDFDESKLNATTKVSFYNALSNYNETDLEYLEDVMGCKVETAEATELIAIVFPVEYNVIQRYKWDDTTEAYFKEVYVIGKDVIIYISGQGLRIVKDKKLTECGVTNEGVLWIDKSKENLAIIEPNNTVHLLSVRETRGLFRKLEHLIDYKGAGSYISINKEDSTATIDFSKIDNDIVVTNNVSTVNDTSELVVTENTPDKEILILEFLEDTGEIIFYNEPTEVDGAADDSIYTVTLTEYGEEEGAVHVNRMYKLGNDHPLVKCAQDESVDFVKQVGQKIVIKDTTGQVRWDGSSVNLSRLDASGRPRKIIEFVAPDDKKNHQINLFAGVDYKLNSTLNGKSRGIILHLDKVKGLEIGSEVSIWKKGCEKVTHSVIAVNNREKTIRIETPKDEILAGSLIEDTNPDTIFLATTINKVVEPRRSYVHHVKVTVLPNTKNPSGHLITSMIRSPKENETIDDVVEALIVKLLPTSLSLPYLHW